MWTHLELSGCLTQERISGPNTGLTGITLKTLLQVLRLSELSGTEMILNNFTRLMIASSVLL